MSNYQNNLQDKQIADIRKHTEKMNSELGEVKEDMASLKTDVAWIKKFITISISLSIGVGGIAVGIAGLLLR